MSISILIILVFVALLLLLITLKWPIRVFGFFLILSPLNYFYVIAFDWQVSWEAMGGVSEGAPPFIKYAKDIVFLGILCSCFLAFLMNRKSWRMKLNTLDLVVSVFVCYQVIMIVPAVSNLGFLPAFIAMWQNTGYISCYFLLRLIISQDHFQHTQVWARNMLLLGGFIALIGIWQFFFGPAPFRYISGTYLGLNRAISTLGSPNILGMYLSFLLLISIVTYSYRINVIQMIAVFLITICLVLTVSMSSLFATLAGVVLILARRKDWKAVLLIVCLAVSGTILVVRWLPEIGERAWVVISGIDESWILRLDNWKELWPSDPLRLLFGSGGGTGGAITISFQKDDSVADNQYLALLIQFGFFGLALYASLLVIGISAVLKGPMCAELPDGVNMRMLAGVLVFLVTLLGLSANVLNAFPINAYFWSALALVGSFSKNCDNIFSLNTLKDLDTRVERQQC